MQAQHQYNRIEAIKQTLPTEEAARHYLGLSLTKRGNKWLTCCPFHQEKTPSFFIFPDGGFKCFGCQASGDVIDLVAKGLHMDTAAVVRMLAADLGIQSDPGADREELRHKIAEQRRISELAARLQANINQEYFRLCGLYRAIWSVIRTVRTEADFDRPEVAIAFHLRPWLEYLLDELGSGDIKRQYEAWRRSRGLT